MKKYIGLTLLLVMTFSFSFGQCFGTEPAYYELIGQNKLKKATKITDGQHTFYSEDKQVITVGTFKNGRFIEGKRFLYNDGGILTRVSHYKNSKYIGDAVPEKEEKQSKDSSK